jgi:muramoyltetrapeptide carboxypeptidase
MDEPVKPPALRPGSTIIVLAPASPVEEARLKLGCDELTRLGYRPRYDAQTLASAGYFAGSTRDRIAALISALTAPEPGVIFCARGGYGSNYLLDHAEYDIRPHPERVNVYDFLLPRILLGYSDITSLQIFYWQTSGWVTFYGPMVASGFDAGAGAPGGYDSASFLRALTETEKGWSLDMQGEALSPGEADGVLLGGCLTMVELTIGTFWELDTKGSILLLEDRGMKPYQVDRALMHLKQAGKFDGVRGIILGEFPESAPPVEGGPSVHEVCRRILGELGMPVVWGAPVGHTPRPMLTVPLGVRARLRAAGSGQLDILEPSVTA